MPILSQQSGHMYPFVQGSRLEKMEVFIRKRMMRCVQSVKLFELSQNGVSSVTVKMQVYEENFLHKSQKHNKKKKAISRSNAQTHIARLISNSTPQPAQCAQTAQYAQQVLQTSETASISSGLTQIQFRFPFKAFKTAKKTPSPKSPTRNISSSQIKMLNHNKILSLQNFT